MSDILVNPLDTLQKYGMSDLEALYSSVKSKIEQITGGGSLESQAYNLNFEKNWVTNNKKYVTWERQRKHTRKLLMKST